MWWVCQLAAVIYVWCTWDAVSMLAMKASLHWHLIADSCEISTLVDVHWSLMPRCRRLLNIPLTCLASTSLVLMYAHFTVWYKLTDAGAWCHFYVFIWLEYIRTVGSESFLFKHLCVQTDVNWMCGSNNSWCKPQSHLLLFVVTAVTM